ncbi:MAG TPA: ribosome-associated translation inhibitor RaiA [Terriglobales bacterium]
MKIEYTGRQYEITPAVRKQVENGLAKLEKLFGNSFDSHVVLSIEKHRHIAEITVTLRNHPIVGIAEAAEMNRAIGEALDKIDRQAVKYKARSRAQKRKSHKEKEKVAARSNARTNGRLARQEPELAQLAIGADSNTAVAVVVHSFPAVPRTAEPHIVRSEDSVAMRPMTLEEAVKEAEFRDREVFVFRDLQGKVKVLHRKKNGKMELIEAP